MKPAGTFTTEWLIERIGSLLESADPELRWAVEEYMRLSGNAQAAYLAKSEEIQYVGGVIDGSWVKGGMKFRTYEEAKAG